MLNARRPGGELLHTANCSLKLQSMVDSSSVSTPVVATLSSTHLFIEAPGSATYRVHNKGDRRFDNLCVPLGRSTRDGGFQGCKLVQPWFGPNYWQGIVVPAAESLLEPHFEFKITLSFPQGGAIEFANQFQQQVQKVLTATDLGIDEVLPEYRP